MAHHKSAIKRIRQSRKRKIYNRGFKKTMREAIKAVRQAQSADEARQLLDKAYSILDRNVAKGIIKKNTAANRKSSLVAHIRRMENA